ncbi:hypothetical protein VKT23_015567 [Stygiomarasmius scandens]|uniref:Uncharacterized protein n=1 Tax=Marasmiellus scandens TaxID=2682957 RepID=A0ABR1J0J9_9AGAR
MVQEKYALHNCFSHIAHEQVTPDLLHELEDFNFWSYFDLLHRDIIAQRHDEADQWPFLLTWRTEVQSCFRFFQDHPSKTQDHLLNSLNHGFYVTEVAPTHIRISEQLEALLAFSESDIPLLQKLGIIHDSELAELVFMMRICNPDFRRKHECVFISFSQGHNTLARACIQVLGDGSPTLHRDIHVYTYSLEYCLVHVAQAPHTADLIIELGEILEFDRSNRWKEFSKTLVGSYTLERIISWLEVYL